MTTDPISFRARVTTTRDAIRSVLERYKKHYRDKPPTWRFWMAPAPQKRIQRLEKLNLETATVADVDAAIGVPSWASLHCETCGNECNALVTLGQFPSEYESRTTDICESCLRAALAAIEELKGGGK